MTKRIVIPLEPKVIESVPVKFPEKCVFCGAPAQKGIPEVIHRNISDRLKYDLAPIEVPYCEKHFTEIMEFDAQKEKFRNKILYPSLIVMGIISILLFFLPIFNWARDNAEKFVGEIMVFLASLLFAAFCIVMIGGLLGFGLVWILDTVFKILKHPPIGFKVYAVSDIFFTIENDQIAQEFVETNKSLGAR